MDKIYQNSDLGARALIETEDLRIELGSVRSKLSDVIITGVGPKGDKGDRGLKGDKGEKGDTGGVSTFVYAFNVDENGDLILNYPEASEQPNFVINEQGELEYIWED